MSLLIDGPSISMIPKKSSHANSDELSFSGHLDLQMTEMSMKKRDVENEFKGIIENKEST